MVVMRTAIATNRDEITVLTAIVVRQGHTSKPCSTNNVR